MEKYRSQISSRESKRLGGVVGEEMANGRKMLKYQTLKENLRERIESGRYLENN